VINKEFCMAENIQAIGNISGSVRLKNVAAKRSSELDNIYAHVIEEGGKPAFVQILNSATQEIIQAIREMVQESNPNARIELVDELNTFFLQIAYAALISGQ